MANGVQIAKENVRRFEEWIADRSAAGDWASYINANRLNRTEIAKECGFAKSVLLQNPVVKTRLERLESELATQGLLTQQPKQSLSEVRASEALERSRRRVNQLEQQNHTLSAENDALKDKLRQLGVLDELLCESGRLPR